MARKFMYVCAGILMLALAWHLGATTATAQVGISNALVAAEGGYAYSANGDVYIGSGAASRQTWTHLGNVFTGRPTPTATQSWGALKAKALR